MLNSDEDAIKRENALRVFENFAAGIQQLTDTQDQMIATQEGLTKQVKILNSQVAALNDMINALGPIMVETLELLRNAGPDDEGEYDDEEINGREDDIRRVEEGLIAAFRTLRKKRPR